MEFHTLHSAWNIEKVQKVFEERRLENIFSISGKGVRKVEAKIQ